MADTLSRWDALWIALAGGAIATVIGFVVRFFAVPSEIAANDRAVRERDEDLEQWLADEHNGSNVSLRGFDASSAPGECSTAVSTGTD